jgi:hypothetical protein
VSIRAKTTTIFIVAASSAATGCGGGGKSVADQAQDICKQSTAKVTALPRPKSVADIKTFIDQSAPILDDATAKLRALKPPNDKKTQWNAWTATLAREVSVIDQSRSAADSGDISKAVTLLQSQQPLSTQGKAQAKALGLAGCGK